MDPENQTQVKNIAERAEGDNIPRSDIIVVLGASDLDGALISAETVTSGAGAHNLPAQPPKQILPPAR